MKEILGIRRSPEFSPNNTGNDSAIFSLTVSELEKQGYKVRQLTEEEFFHTDKIEENTIFSMIRNKHNVEKLKMLEEGMGKRIINSGFGIERCFRDNMTELLLGNGVPHPQSEIISTYGCTKKSFEKLGKNLWIKRGDFHTVHKEDIAFCRNYEEGNSILKEYALRGIPNAVLSEHLVGDLVKFYAVEGTPFFHWFYPFETNHLMSGTQNVEQTQHYSFDEQELKSVARRAAKILGIKIYGGDAVISADHRIQLIDVNDWPSFAPCRAEAAKHIAAAIIKF